MTGFERMATIYQRVLKDRLELLPAVLRQFLSQEHGGSARGRLTVTRAAGWLRNFAAWALGIPPAGDYDLLLEVIPHGVGQRWVRHFDNYTLTTVQTEWRGLLIERKGLASLGFELIIRGETLLFKPRRAWVLVVPAPLWLSPCIEAENWANEALAQNYETYFINLWDSLRNNPDKNTVLKNAAFDKIIVGLPEGKIGQTVLGFIKALRKNGLDVTETDETLSSRKALEEMIKQNVSKKQREMTDSVAAAIILQNYLDSQ